MGFMWTDREEEAHMLGILACSVRQKSIDKVYSRISKWNRWKKDRNLITFVSGCMLPADKEKFLKLFDLVFTMDELPELEDMVRQYGVVTPASLRTSEKSEPGGMLAADAEDTWLETAPDLLDILKENKILLSRQPEGPGDGIPLKPAKDPTLIRKFWKVTPHYSSPFEAFIPIQNGCDKFCTFCAVPYTRGREVSRSSEEILSELHELVENGYKSITLLGQNVNSYGLDKRGDEIPFHYLLEEIGKYGEQSGKEFWVYFTSPHPRDMSDEVIDVMARYDCLAKQVHLPVQSGDDKVLIRMNRKHNMERYRKLILTIRKKLPEATIFTDIIVGFTGETAAQFENTRKIMEEFRFNMAYVAMYSPRPGATSSRWEDDIPQDVKKERLRILTEELVKYNRIHNRNLIGKSIRVLVTGQDRKEGFLRGLTEGKLIVRFPEDDPSLMGQFIDLQINSAADFSLEGEKLNIIEELNEP
jgi:tRNA-2-methylthio-N6-dimethylallyladenosine synthase